MPDVPAIVINHRMDVLAWNRGAAGLLTDWPRAGKSCVATLRMEAGSRPDDPALNALVGELSVRDKDFRTWWATHQGDRVIAGNSLATRRSGRTGSRP